MAAGEAFAARAQAALDSVSRDTLARGRFTRAYTGTGDAVLALRAAANPAVGDVADEQFDELRRIAFGRPRNAQEENAATAARQALHDEERLRRDAEAVDRAIQALGETLGTAPPRDSPPVRDNEDGFAATRPARVLRRTWLIPIVALCLAAGYGGSALGRQPTGSAPSPPVGDSGSVTLFPVVDPDSAAQAGWTIAAEEWFSPPQVEEDTVDAPTLLGDLGIDPATTRFVGTTVHGALLWIAKTPNHSYCVIGIRPRNGGAFGSCTTVGEFRRAGLELTQGLDSVRWDGIKFTTSSTTSAYG